MAANDGDEKIPGYEAVRNDKYKKAKDAYSDMFATFVAAHPDLNVYEITGIVAQCAAAGMTGLDTPDMMMAAECHMVNFDSILRQAYNDRLEAAKASKH